jgi:hypothetical protein
MHRVQQKPRTRHTVLMRMHVWMLCTCRRGHGHAQQPCDQETGRHACVDTRFSQLHCASSPAAHAQGGRTPESNSIGIVPASPIRSAFTTRPSPVFDVQGTASKALMPLYHVEGTRVRRFGANEGPVGVECPSFYPNVLWVL